jgi:hypothetical protein
MKNIKYLFISLLVAFLGFGCSTNSSNESSATISGSVEGQESQQKVQSTNVEGAVVTAAEVTSSGSIQTIEGTETETDASGNFNLDVDVESAQNIAIVAENEGQTWMGYLSGEVENGSSYTLKPINTESTAETEVYSEVVSSGNANMVSKADVEAAISSSAAATINSSSSNASRVATGLKNAAEARAEFYAETMGEGSEEALNATAEAAAEAQFQLEAELASTTSEQEREEAYNIFVESMVNAYTTAGLEASNAAKSIEMWSRVYVNSVASASTEVRNDARQNTSLLAATAIDLAVRSEAEASGMSESSQQAILDAGVELKSAVKASAGARSEVEAAFETYHEEVRSTMENDSSLDASVIIEIDSEINSIGGVKSTFNSSIAAVVDASLAYDVYESFYASISGMVESSLEGASESQVSAVSNVLILINLAS